MVESADVLRQFIYWCETCANNRGVSKHRLPGHPTKIICRTCGSVLALEGGEENGKEEG